jgi:5-methyltetrahydropteroyltriglutamate--homocysteine methyltransferase
MSHDFLRADVVGSLLRPAAWREARAAFDEGRMSEQDFRGIEDAAVRDAIRFQESLGLEVVTDGEIRRLNFQDSFGAAVSGFAASATTLNATQARVSGGKAMARFDMPDLHQHGPAITRRRPAAQRLKLERNVLLDEYRFAKSVAKQPVKVTLIGPDRIAQRFAHEESKAVYADIDAFLADVVAIERQMIASVAEAGCRYVQIDAPGYTAYVDEPSLATMRKRGEDPMRNFERSLAADAAVLKGFDEVTFGIHLCRGNQHSMWHREGHYDAIAERLFNALPHRRFLLEYDSPRAGSFEPLRFVPKGKVCVLGLVSTKVGELETPEALARRVDEAARYVPLEQLALSPQCGFASDVAGNRITEEDQRRKLEIVVETARRVWGA